MGDNNEVLDTLPKIEQNANVSQNFGRVEFRGNTISFNLTIFNFSQHREETGSRLQTVSSGIANGIQICVSVYPKGNNKEYENYVGISLLFEAPKDCGRGIVLTTGIIDANHEKHFVKQYPNVSPNTDMMYVWENKRFISHEELRSCNLLSDDCLRIQCFIKFSINFPIILENQCTSSVMNDVALRLFNDVKFSDITITADEQSFRAHKAILAAHSKTFATMFEYHKDVLPIGDMDSEVLREMLRFIYMGKVNNMEKFSCELLAAAERFDLQKLKSMCEQALCVGIILENVVECAILAHLHNAKQLKAYAINFMWSHADALKDTERFKSMAIKYPDLIAEAFTMMAVKNVRKQYDDQQYRSIV